MPQKLYIHLKKIGKMFLFIFLTQTIVFANPDFNNNIISNNIISYNINDINDYNKLINDYYLLPGFKYI